MPLKFRWETEFKGTEIGNLKIDPNDTSGYMVAQGVCGNIPKDWTIKSIGSDYDVNTGKRVAPKNEGLVPVYCANGFSGFSDKYLIDQKAIITGRVGTLGQVFYVNKKADVSDNAFYITRKNEEASLKSLYFSMSFIWKNIKEVLNVGTSQPLMKQSEVKKLLIPFPYPAERFRIATVLSWFDDLIENKKRQNEILEETAMAIFKGWFIDFEPFKKEKFIDSELGGIPEGWEVKAIGDKDVATLFKGISYNSPDISPEPQGCLFITLNNFLRGGGFKAEYCYYIGNRANESHKVKDGELIIALTDMTPKARVVGAPAIVILSDACDFGVISLDCAKLQPVNDYLKHYLYLYLKFSQEENSTFANGVNVLHLNTKLFMQNKLVVIPLRPVLEKFHSLVEPLFQKIITNQKQIMTLRKTRDILLPLLVFGKLRVESV